MKTAILVAAACALLAGSAYAQSAATDDFVKKVAISDMFEIQSSQLALKKKPDADTKPFAQKMVKEHKKTSSELKSLVKSGKVKAELPKALDAEHKNKLGEMRKLSGKDFDKSYDQAQQQAHKDAVSLFEKYSQSGDNPALKEWAQKTLPALKEHLNMAEKLVF